MDDRSLAGRRVAVTGSDVRALVDELARLGAEVAVVPLIEILPAEDRDALEDAIANVAEYDWIVLTSANGVAAIAPALASLGAARVATVGPVTAAAVRARGVEPASVAGGASDEIPDGLGLLGGARILLPQADLAGPELATALRERGADVDVVVAYQTVPARVSEADAERLGSADAIVLASGSAARSLVASVGAGEALLVCIGPKTAAVARELGLEIGLVADETSTDGIIRALVSHFGDTR